MNKSSDVIREVGVSSPLHQEVQQLLWFTERPVGGQKRSHKVWICNREQTGSQSVAAAEGFYFLSVNRTVHRHPSKQTNLTALPQFVLKLALKQSLFILDKKQKQEAHTQIDDVIPEHVSMSLPVMC